MLAARIGKPVEELERAVYLAMRRRTTRHIGLARRLFSALDAYLWVRSASEPAEIDDLLRYFLIGVEAPQSEVDTTQPVDEVAW